MALLSLSLSPFALSLCSLFANVFILITLSMFLFNSCLCLLSAMFYLSSLPSLQQQCVDNDNSEMFTHKEIGFGIRHLGILSQMSPSPIFIHLIFVHFCIRPSKLFPITVKFFFHIKNLNIWVHSDHINTNHGRPKCKTILD